MQADSRSAALWLMGEQADSVLPSDEVGRLPPATVPVGIARPAVADGTPSGFGREFTRATATGLLVSDTDGHLRLTRGVTIVALARLDVVQLADGDVCTVVQRGRGGVGDVVSWQLHLAVLDQATRQVTMSLGWQTAAGVDVIDDGVTFIWPDGEYLLLTATREVVGETLQARYQVNSEALVGGSHALDCDGDVAADVSIGMAMVGATYGNHFDGVIDALEVLGEAVSPEELAWTWDRLALDQPSMVDTMRRMVPPGVYSRDLSSSVQRELTVEGVALGHLKSLARRLRFYHLPDVAFGDKLARWEAIIGHSPKPGDDIQRRRDRLLWFFGAVRGFGVLDVKEQLAEPFDLEPHDVVIQEFGNDYVRDFASAIDPGDAVIVTGSAAWTFPGGTLRGDTGSAKDTRYGGSSAASPRASLYLVSLAHPDDSWSIGKVAIVGSSGAAAAGMVLGRMDTDAWIFVGVRQVSTVSNELVWWEYRNGVLDATPTVLGTLNYTPVFLRIHQVFIGASYGGSDQPVTFQIYVGSSDAAARASTPYEVVRQFGGAPWAGFFVGGAVDAATADVEANFDDLSTHTPNGDQGLNWYAFRDPTLDGNPDMIGARLLVRRLAPAHTFGAAHTAENSLLCDDPDNGCEQAPIRK